MINFKSLSLTKINYTLLLRSLLLIAISSSLFWHLHATWHQALFGDEVHSLFFFYEHSWWSLLTSSVEPIHPNGTYLLLKMWYLVTPTVLALRVWMFALFLLSCFVLWQILTKLLFARELKMLGILLWSSSAYVWHFSFQLRMYGPAILLILLSLWALLSRKQLVSLIFDWLLLFFAYGGVIYVAAKWLAYFILWLLKSKKDPTRESKFQIGWILTAAILPILFILNQYISQSQVIAESYLYWVKTPVWQDWSLGLLAFSSGLFLPYFEGYAQLSQKWLTLGSVANLVLIATGLVALSLVWFKRNILQALFNKLSFAERFMILVWLLIIGAYTVIFIWSIVNGNHLFHIRQLFAVAVINWLMLLWLANLFWKVKPKLVVIVLIGVIVANQILVIKDSWADGQAYAHHFSQLPGLPVVASASDIELIYKQCHTFNRIEATAICKDQDIYLNHQSFLQTPPHGTWWATKRAANDLLQNKLESFDKIVCQTISQDFTECHFQE